MNGSYHDIIDRIDEPPSWFDDQAVPRYVAFAPGELANIYAREAALAEVSCQSCGRRFVVALTDSFASREEALADMIRLRTVHYGDPPNVGCCPAGPTMNSIMHAILEYWTRDAAGLENWHRVSRYEGPVTGPRLIPADTVAAVGAAIADGARTIRVDCTSSRNRYDLFTRVAATQPPDARILVVCADRELGIVHHCLEAHLAETEFGPERDGRRVVLSTLEKADDPEPSRFGLVLVLAPGRLRSEQTAQRWRAASSGSQEGSGAVWIEFVVDGAVCLIEDPTVTLDAAATRRRPSTRKSR